MKVCGGLGFGIVLLGEACFCRVGTSLGEGRPLGELGDLGVVAGDDIVNGDVHGVPPSKVYGHTEGGTA